MIGAAILGVIIIIIFLEGKRRFTDLKFSVERLEEKVEVLEKNLGK